MASRNKKDYTGIGDGDQTRLVSGRQVVKDRIRMRFNFGWAERLRLSRKSGVRPETLRYLNRLSDYLSLLGRWGGLRRGDSEYLWQASVHRDIQRAESSKISTVQHSDGIEAIALTAHLFVP